MPVLMAWCIAVMSSCQRNEPEVDPAYAELRQALEKIELFSTIEADPDTAAVRKRAQGELDYKAQYSLFFTQDLDHTDEGGESFQQRVCILFRGFDRPTILVTHGYYWGSFNDAADLGANLNANMVHVEHRNYGYSSNSDKGKWHYQTIAQASADLHAVYETLKPIFPGKWICAGTSKSAETSIAYAYFYPEDMCAAVSFCGPFVLGQDDQRFSHYLFEQVSTADNRELMRSGIRLGLQDGENGIYRSVCQTYESEGGRIPIFSEYVFNLFDTFFQVFQYVSDEEERAEVLTDLATDSEALAEEVCVTMDGNRMEEFYAYFIECAKEMGWQNNGYEYFSDLLDGTTFNKEEVLPSILKEQDRALVAAYDGSVYENIVNDFFINTTCPLLLYYVRDDPWSAGAPEQVGPLVKKIVNPIGRHSSYINDPDLCPPAIKEEVVDFVRSYVN